MIGRNFNGAEESEHQRSKVTRKLNESNNLRVWRRSNNLAARGQRGFEGGAPNASGDFSRFFQKI